MILRDILFRQIAFPEAERQQTPYGLYDIDFFFAVEINAHRLGVAFLCFENYLPASTTGCCGVVDEIPAGLSGDSQRLYGQIGILRVGIE